MNKSLVALTEALLAAAKKAGADAADAIAAEGESASIEVRGGALEHADRAEGIEIGLRVFTGKRQACVSSSDVRPDTISAMAERAVAMAREAPEDPWCGQAEPGDLARDWDAGALELDDPAPRLAPAALEAMAREAEAAALAVKGVSQTQSAGAGQGRSIFHIALSNGFAGGYAHSSTSLSCVAISGEGLTMEREYAGEGRTFAADLPSALSIGTLAGQRAAERIGPRKPPTGAFPVLYDERVAGGLIGHLAGAINGSAITRGSSWLKDALGEAVLPEGLDLTEDPFRKRIGGSRPFDGEGLPVALRHLVKDGVLQGWTLDLATARQLGLKSTGNAARGTSSPPSPAAGNLTLTPGSASRDDLMREMGTGLLVTGLLGSSINPTTGDYSRGASGFWVEGGEIRYPVNECTIAGNLRSMLKTIRPANDGRTELSRVVPSLLVEGLMIAGA